MMFRAFDKLEWTFENGSSVNKLSHIVTIFVIHHSLLRSLLQSQISLYKELVPSWILLNRLRSRTQALWLFRKLRFLITFIFWWNILLYHTNTPIRASHYLRCWAYCWLLLNLSLRLIRSTQILWRNFFPFTLFLSRQNMLIKFRFWLLKLAAKVLY